MMVLAGAGSGKTRVLTRRLAYLILSGAASPETILAVTFTNKAAREMRERVLELLGLDAPSGVAHRFWIGTFHGMGARMLRQQGKYLGYDPDFTILDTADQERLAKRICDESSFDHKYWTPKRLINHISRWKDDGITPDRLDEVNEREFLNPGDKTRVHSFYQSYQESLMRANAMDFGDLLLNCLELWRRHPDLLAHWQHRFGHLLVDEYQDTNAVQYRWAAQLADLHKNLCVVGDDDQSIYSWRGARLDNILHFKDDFPDVTVIRLEQNYRSTGNILRAASELIKHNQGRMEKSLWTEDDDGRKIDLFTAESSEDEARFVASEIGALCPLGDFSRAAVLVRASRQTRAIEEGLMRQGIPYQVVGGLRFMDRAEIRDALAYLRLVHSARDDVAFERVVNVPKRGVGQVAMAKIRAVAMQESVPLLEATRRLVAAGGISGKAKTALKDFVMLIDEARQICQLESPAMALAHLLDRSGYVASLDGHEKRDEKMDNLAELRGVLVRSESLTMFLEETALVTDMHESGEPSPNRVVISTLHAAKGLEFPYVFLVGMEEETLPHSLAVNEGAEGLEEERRLAYVGITRARERLYLTHARKRWMYSEPTFPMPSRFLRELPAEVLEDRGPKFSVKFGASGSIGLPSGGSRPFGGGGGSPRFRLR
ncbi:putative ATP-dependent DNA helicase Rep [Magnetofaba australis IT-1]|uniref:DNA 3'-5' helicase n=1 Tax=Magnetofaba australis IT-1 TaxID=1434232 RepID=A0A1Y2K2U3_9PROT|nr:putative ATP-dependent DNA helicase Rep [Magnetofaba australis IT-1]